MPSLVGRSTATTATSTSAFGTSDFLLFSLGRPMSTSIFCQTHTHFSVIPCPPPSSVKHTLLSHPMSTSIFCQTHTLLSHHMSTPIFCQTHTDFSIIPSVLIGTQLPLLSRALPEFKKKITLYNLCFCVFRQLMNCTMLADLCPCFHRSPTKLCPDLISFACTGLCPDFGRPRVVGRSRSKLCPMFGRLHAKLCPISYAPSIFPTQVEH